MSNCKQHISLKTSILWLKKNPQQQPNIQSDLIFNINQLFPFFKQFDTLLYIISYKYITVNDLEFDAYQQKQVNGSHLGPLCLISAVGVLHKSERRLE